MASEADEVAARLRAELPRALQDGHLVGYFQPEVELSTGQLVAAELLARWEHPELGTLPPSAFLSLIEELGLMTEFSLEMLRQALVQHRTWAAAGCMVPVAVNIGPGCVADPEFPAAVSRLLAEEQVPGQMIALEVSEETSTSAVSARFFAQLAATGIQFSLDDFGTGFASLESLGGWPINELKLDSSIVRPIVTSKSFRAIVRKTIDLAHELGIKVVGEGVESAAIGSELEALGCDIGQGFYLGRPMPPEAFSAWVRDPGRLTLPADASGYPAPSPPPPRPPHTGGLISLCAVSAAGALRRSVRQVGGRTIAAAVLVLVVYGLWQMFRWGGRQNQALIGDLAFVPVNGAAVVLAWRVSRRADLGYRICRAWRLLSLAMFLYLLGDLLQFWIENVMHRVAYPTWSDAAYLGFYVVAFCGLISFPARRDSGSERLRRLLDLGTVFTGGAVLIWYLALGPAVGKGLHFDLFNIVTYAYPVGDLLLLFGILTLLWRGVPQSSVMALQIFAVGLLLFIAADLTYAYITVHSTYLGGDPVDTLWMLGVTAVCISAASQLRTKPTGTTVKPAQSVPGRPSFLPYVAVLSSYILLAFVGLRSVGFNPLGGILLGALMLTLLVSVRQYVALRDYGQLTARYQQLASIDGTTGLSNRRHFMETAETAFAHAQRLGQPVVALMIDVDNFKHINDLHGHIAGDEVLIDLARACRENVRPEDIVGRYGGDEFVIIVPGITSVRAIHLADQLTRRVTDFHSSDGKPLAYNSSVGIAQCPPYDDLTALLIHADRAMYAAKQAGGGAWRIFNDDAGAEQLGTGETAISPSTRPALDLGY
jgi:diguanylate cyclase (GGDEF)-like protein